MAEALAVIALIAVVLLIGAVSVYAGRRAAELRTCQDQMHAIQAELQNYYARNSRQYPADQTAFNQFLQNRTYFSSGEPHCPWDEAKATHYTYQYNPAVNSSAEGIKILCPVPKSGHGSVP
jgi:type II secretory pathway pseudopilin PulG